MQRSGQRNTPCRFGNRCKRPDCYYQHPPGSGPQNNPQAAAFNQQQAPPQPVSRTLKVTGFGPQVTDFAAASFSLQAAFNALTVNIPNAADVSASEAVAMAFFGSENEAKAALQKFQTSAADLLGLGTLKVELHYPTANGRLPTTRPPVANARPARPATAPSHQAPQVSSPQTCTHGVPNHALIWATIY